jgi:nitronate monooxygenase
MFLTDDLTTQVGTLALVPQVVRAVRVPVIAAGGIADAKGVAAAMALGARACRSAPRTSFARKRRRRRSIARAGERRLAPHGAHQPVLRTAVAQHREPVDARSRPDQQCAARVPARDLGHCAACARKRKPGGSGDFSPLWSGQNASGCRSEPPRASRARWQASGDAPADREYASRRRVHEATLRWNPSSSSSCCR